MGTTGLGFWAFLPGQPPSSQTYPTLEQPFLGKLQTQTQPQLMGQNGPHHLLLVASFYQQESYGPGWGSDLPKIRQLQWDQKTLALPSGSVLFPCLHQCWFLSLAHMETTRAVVQSNILVLIRVQLDSTWIQPFAECIFLFINIS